MTDRMSALRVFVRVARSGSFSRAARELRLSQPSASRIVAALEREIGATLFTRSTRALSLTEAGAEYLGRVETALTALDEAEHAARGTGELRGVLRIAASSSFTEHALIPRLDEFLGRNPRLRVVLLVADQRQALVTEGVDVAFRFGSLAAESGASNACWSHRRLICAAQVASRLRLISIRTRSSRDRSGWMAGHSRKMDAGSPSAWKVAWSFRRTKAR